MAHCHTNHLILSERLHQEFSRNFINIRIGSSLNGINNVEIPSSPYYTVTAKAFIGSSRKSVKSWSSANPQSSSQSPQLHLSLAGGEEEVKLEHGHQLKDNNGISRQESSGFLVRDHEYGWEVRKMVQSEDEIREVAEVQAEAFYEPAFFFNALFFHFFKAEVLSGLLYRLKNSPPQRYACLVAQRWKDMGEIKAVVGVVDVTVFRDRNVLRHLEGAHDYLYISGIAVLRKFRRQKVATALLKACEMIANQWGFEYLVLMAYEEDLGAQTLYTNVGYKVVSKDPPWLTSWIGRRRRVLMVKRSNKVNSL
ncbi:unnamed protein product [Cuscuta epithymum]|uniref:N-acetyltransferase domain-containing protein n=1 Tax=Cuscuta epithymum TaxID=186058 RepID=A0AAV0ET40_9ASTE|nr:unnamed protein product [Cuscuta epithymum]